MKKQIIGILLISSFLALVLFLFDSKEAGNTNQVVRNTYGKGSKSETYEVTVGEVLQEEPITVEVGEREYSSQEIQEIFKTVIEELDELILGENESLDHVGQNLNLVTSIKEYPVQIQWELDSYDVMNVYGEIQTEHTKEEGTLIELRAALSCGKEKALYVTNAMVYPKTRGAKEGLLHQVTSLLKQKEEKTREEEIFVLPTSVDGQKIQWRKKTEPRWCYVLLLGCVVACFLPLLQKQKESKQKEERKQQMLTDYPEIISKLTMLLSTGMTVKNVWEKMVLSYEEHKKQNGQRAAYEEMSYSFYEMQGGVPEGEAYERFGRRCGVPAYVKFGALLSQNLRKGTKGLTDLLALESIQAFENRKSRARRLGEEASTKLLIPMFAMLGVVLIIVVVPAFLSMQL